MTAEGCSAEGARCRVLKIFSIEKEASDQRLIEVVPTSLSNVRRLIKAGGFFVAGELTSTDLLFSDTTVGTLPGPWVGAAIGPPWGLLLSLRQWNSISMKASFAGIDTVTPDIGVTLPMNTFVAQAVNDQVTPLRNPLAVSDRPALTKWSRYRRRHRCLILGR